MKALYILAMLPVMLLLIFTVAFHIYVLIAIFRETTYFREFCICMAGLVFVIILPSWLFTWGYNSLYKKARK